MIVQIDDLRINMKARDWCKLPYPDHPKGCPNYGQRATCPPDAPLIYNFVDIGKPIFLIAVGFNLENHVNSMLLKHPDWSNRQAKCVLYWQGSVNKLLKQHIKQFLWMYPEYITTLCPEAMGVNVIETARRCGLPIKTKPTKNVFKIALAGIAK